MNLCFTAILTLHLLIPQVLENKPERECGTPCIYVAPLDCNLLGQDIELTINGITRKARAVDCASWNPPVPGPTKGNPPLPWFGDLDIAAFPTFGVRPGGVVAKVCLPPSAFGVPASSPTLSPTATPTAIPRQTQTPDGRIRRRIVIH